MADFGKMSKKAGAYVGRVLLDIAVNTVAAVATGAAVKAIQQRQRKEDEEVDEAGVRPIAEKGNIVKKD